MSIVYSFTKNRVDQKSFLLNLPEILEHIRRATLSFFYK